MVVGLDFDNTIVTYDAVLHQAARERGLIPLETPVVKRIVRDYIRDHGDGDIDWQKLQALVYGPLMPQAQMFPGVAAFVRECRRRQVPVKIVSHKTELAGYDETGTNLRAAALAWMTEHDFFSPNGLALTRDDVFFESTRDDKIARIRALACTEFVDDLEEVLHDPAFPPQVQRILFAPEAQLDTAADPRVVPTWEALTELVLDARG